MGSEGCCRLTGDLRGVGDFMRDCGSSSDQDYPGLSLKKGYVTDVDQTQQPKAAAEMLKTPTGQAAPYDDHGSQRLAPASRVARCVERSSFPHSLVT